MILHSRVPEHKKSEATSRKFAWIRSSRLSLANAGGSPKALISCRSPATSPSHLRHQTSFSRFRLFQVAHRLVQVLARRHRPGPTLTDHCTTTNLYRPHLPPQPPSICTFPGSQAAKARLCLSLTRTLARPSTSILPYVIPLRLASQPLLLDDASLASFCQRLHGQE